MQALRLDEVLRRVVAWHNRHPLARRISASQVHSIGEVQLPFASAQALPGNRPVAVAESAATVDPADLVEATADADPPPPQSAHTLTPPDAEIDPPAIGSEVELEIDIDLPGTAASAADSDYDGPGEAALEMPPIGAEPAAPLTDPHLDGAPAQDLAPSSSDAQASDAEQAAAAAAVHKSSALVEPVDSSLDGKPRWRPADPALRPPRPLAAAPQPAATPPTPQRSASLPWLVALRTALTGRQPGMPALRAVFSRDFIWPLRPSQVARWVQRHGQPGPLAPTDWPQRLVDTDAQRLARARQQGLPHPVLLHVLTAAIGVGDRRIRVLIDGRGAVIGPRAYQRSRVATAASLLLVAAVGLGWGLRPPGAPADDGEAPAGLAELAASAATPAASAATEVLAMAAVAPIVIQHADAAASAVTSADQASAAASAASAASAAQASLRPDLAAEARRSALELEAAASAAAAPAQPVPPVYAVVTRPSRMRQTAVDFLPTMRSASVLLQASGPDQREVMKSQGKWFAAWWPFATLADAERARVLLAGRGLKTEVIEF